MSEIDDDYQYSPEHAADLENYTTKCSDLLRLKLAKKILEDLVFSDDQVIMDRLNMHIELAEEEANETDETDEMIAYSRITNQLICMELARELLEYTECQQRYHKVIGIVDADIAELQNLCHSFTQNW